MRKGKLPYALGWSQLIDAALSARAGDNESAIELLEQAEANFEECDMARHVAVSWWRRGELMGGDAGEERLAEARRFFEEQSVVNPVAMVRMLAPGFKA